MSKTLITLLLGLFLTSLAWPQETATSGASEEPESVTAADTEAPDEAAGGIGEVGEPGSTAGAGEPGSTAGAAPTEVDEAEDLAEPDIVDPDFDDAELDEQTYEEDEDDFIPSEEIPADEPIPFPSNI